MMSGFGASRRRMLAAKGRPMTLQRPNPATGSAPSDVTAQGFLAPFAPEAISGALREGDAQAHILADEITAAAWPAPPRSGDYLVVDGDTWLVQGANALYDGATLIGYTLWIRGGQT